MLNSQLDVQQLHGEYTRKNRILIRNALEPDSAGQLLRSLNDDIPWQIAYMEKGKPCVFSREQRAAMSDEQWAAIQKKITALGARGFQFCYGHYSVSDRNREQCRPDAFVNAFGEFLKSDRFLEFARAVTGMDEVIKVEILAARYSGGDFLMMHNDTQKPERRAAFVFNLSRDWHPDWGGLTHFLDVDGTVTDTYVPTYNSLVIFTVPVLHLVSYVMPFAPRPRYSITGWLTV
ncbi:MAG: 2OG-Fe(II) oxygenase family protein [Pseudomonadota bacterium]